MLRLSETPTEFIAIRVNCNNEYADSPAMAIVPVTEEFRLQTAKRIALAREVKTSDESLSCLLFSGGTIQWVERAGDEAQREELDVIESEAEDNDWCFVQGWEEDLLPEFGSLRGHAIVVDDDGDFWFECYGKHSGDEYSTPAINLNKVFTT